MSLKYIKILWDREHYWNSKYRIATKRYRIDTKRELDLRRTLECSWGNVESLQRVADRITKNCKNDDEKAYACWQYVQKRLKYVSDPKKWNKPERWQDPFHTYISKNGDCEDGALLISKLMQLAGIPAYKRKMCAGWVQPNKNAPAGGHAYVIYLASDDNWYVCDWCYFSATAKSAWLKKSHKRLEYYKDIWFTWNEVYVWSKNSAPRMNIRNVA